MNQTQAINILTDILGYIPHRLINQCSRITKTCKVPECMLCSVRDCPDNEPLHYHHDGCPACYRKENASTTQTHS